MPYTEEDKGARTLRNIYRHLHTLEPGRHLVIHAINTSENPLFRAVFAQFAREKSGYIPSLGFDGVSTHQESPLAQFRRKYEVTTQLLEEQCYPAEPSPLYTVDQHHIVANIAFPAFNRTLLLSYDTHASRYVAQLQSRTSLEIILPQSVTPLFIDLDILSCAFRAAFRGNPEGYFSEYQALSNVSSRIQ